MVTSVLKLSHAKVSDEMGIIAFYNELSPLVQYISKHNVLIISGDMNAHKSKCENNKQLFKQKWRKSSWLFFLELACMPKH